MLSVFYMNTKVRSLIFLNNNNNNNNKRKKKNPAPVFTFDNYIIVYPSDL